MQKKSLDKAIERHVDESRYQRLLHLMPAAYFELNPDGKILFVNKAMGTLSGYCENELVGQDWWTRFRPVKIEAEDKDLDKMLTAPVTGKQCVNVTTKDGKLITLDISFSNEYNDDGSLELISGFAVSSSAGNLTSENEEQLQDLLESVKDYAIYKLDIHGNVSSWNKGAQQIKGFKPDEIIGKHFSRFLPASDQSEISPDVMLQTAVRQGKYEGEGWQLRKDGSVYWAAVVISPIFDKNGHLKGFSKIVRDITHRKRAEENLRLQTEYIRLLQDIAFAANEAASVEDAMEYALKRVCEHTGWHIGHALIVADKPPDTLETMKIWYLSDPIHFETFRNESERLNFSPGVGLPGRAYSAASPVWMKDVVVDDTYTRKSLAKDSGIRTGAAFPVMVGKAVAGVLEFYSQVDIVPDEQLLRVMEQIGTQLGRVIERKQKASELAELQKIVLESREIERLHLAREIHDGPIQDLYGLTFQLQALGEKLNDDEKQELQDLQGLFTKVIVTLRAICKEMQPPTLAPFGLEKAIRSHAEILIEKNPIDIRLDLMPDGQILPAKTRLGLFRIYQQAFLHAVNHAEAKNVSVSFYFNQNEIILEVEDDGNGFVVPDRWVELARRGHMELVGAAERAEALGGQLKIESEPGVGTKIKVIIPRRENQSREL